jgi:Arm DNA-binding domain
VIGHFPTWTARRARARAAELRRLIDQGRDPLGEKIATREAPTVAELLAEYAAIASARS